MKIGSIASERLAIIIICVILLASGGWNAITLSSQQYTTAYEGAKASFYGLDWNYQDGTSGRETFALKGTTFNFDKDGPTSREWAPNLVGEMTAIFVPEAPNPIPKEWGSTIRDWWDTTQYIQNPVNKDPYEWDIYDADWNETTLYAMDEYTTKWYFSISCDWNDHDGESWKAEYYDKRYMDTQVWFEFDIAPLWYFEGADVTYFAIAELRISELTFGRITGHERQEGQPSDSCRTIPMSAPSILTIYSEPYGEETESLDFDAYTIRGHKLNPKFFRDKVYSYFTLVNFGTQYWTEWGGAFSHWKGDVVTVGLDVMVFVVGEWKVQDIQEIPDEYGRTSQTGSGGLEGLANFLYKLWNNPNFQAWFWIGVIALVVLLLAIFAPWVLFAISGLAKGLGSSIKQKGGG